MCIERELNGLSRSCIDISFRLLQGLHIGRHQTLPLADEANIISDRRGNISSIASSIGYGAPQEFLVTPPSFLLTAKQLNGNFFNGVGPCGCFGTSLRRMKSAAGPPAFFYFSWLGWLGIKGDVIHISYFIHLVVKLGGDSMLEVVRSLTHVLLIDNYPVADTNTIAR